eukprot:scaffold95221_cov36-Phaeocystis_antarctica.AAC.1
MVPRRYVHVREPSGAVGTVTRARDHRRGCVDTRARGPIKNLAAASDQTKASEGWTPAPAGVGCRADGDEAVVIVAPPPPPRSSAEALSAVNRTSREASK